MSNPALLPATEAASRLRDGRLTAVALLEATLSVIAEREPVVRAFAWLDADGARQAAARSDAARRAGHPGGPLAGLTLGVKDVLDTADLPSQYGSPIWSGHRPRTDAAAVALFRRAGAIVIGKTVTTEFATRHPGPTSNPANPAHTPGGSSSGSAAGAVAGFFHAGIGTQTAGSIIRPAAFCGAVGYKPSFGTLHRAGMKVMSESLDTIGVIARSAADCALFVGAAAGRDFGAWAPPPDRAPRLAVTLEPAPADATDAARVVLDQAVRAAAARGATITRFDLPRACIDAFERHATVMNAESADALAWERDHAAALLSSGLRERMDWGATRSRDEVDAGRASFAAARAAFADAMAPYDALLTLPAPGEAPVGLGWTGDPSFNTLWTLLHGPCLTVPVGVGPLGLPLGVQLVAPMGQDTAALGWAEWLARALA